ncbi:hypothetical protein SDC9_58267 [bioreactor metagenome]|uniref:Uncharacterized protein n=1 Tax=bioreactor metagenome TaxID=1076179 RepID=A0A644X6W2_9ZZZZ
MRNRYSYITRGVLINYIKRRAVQRYHANGRPDRERVGAAVCHSVERRVGNGCRDAGSRTCPTDTYFNDLPFSTLRGGLFSRP